MKSYPCHTRKLIKPLGHFIGETLYFDNENEVKKLHMQFMAFIRNKEERNQEIIKYEHLNSSKEFSF